MDVMDLIREKFSQDCSIGTVLHLVMAEYGLSEEKAQAEIDAYFEIVASYAGNAATDDKEDCENK